jgi:hypothetical protein
MELECGDKRAYASGAWHISGTNLLPTVFSGAIPKEGLSGANLKNAVAMLLFAPASLGLWSGPFRFLPVGKRV